LLYNFDQIKRVSNAHAILSVVNKDFMTVMLIMTLLDFDLHSPNPIQKTAFTRSFVKYNIYDN